LEDIIVQQKNIRWVLECGMVCIYKLSKKEMKSIIKSQ
jgi:hypothetical protein